MIRDPPEGFHDEMRCFVHMRNIKGIGILQQTKVNDSSIGIDTVLQADHQVFLPKKRPGGDVLGLVKIGLSFVVSDSLMEIVIIIATRTRINGGVIKVAVGRDPIYLRFLIGIPPVTVLKPFHKNSGVVYTRRKNWMN